MKAEHDANYYKLMKAIDSMENEDHKKIIRKLLVSGKEIDVGWLKIKRVKPDRL